MGCQLTIGNKLLLLFLLVAATLLPASATVTAGAGQPGIEIEINGELAVFTDAQPYVDTNFRTMVPVRFVSENLGARVHWDEPTRTVTITKGDSLINLQVDSSLIIVNGKEKQMDTRMVFNDRYNRNYVPLRFVSENLGSNIALEHRGTVMHIAIRDDFARSAGPINEAAVSSNNIHGVSIGDSADAVLSMLGEPGRKEPSAYGYTWWVYNQDYHNYLQVGIKDSRVVNIFSNSNNWEYKGLKNGVTFNEATKIFPFESELELKHDGGTYTISQRSLPVEKYLVFTEEEIALQIYIDIHDGDKVTAIRLSEPSFILATTSFPFKFSWTGERPRHEAAPLTAAKQQAVDRANEKQLLDLVNAVRVRMKLQPLRWHQEIASVAYAHSVDMRDNNFFAHTSPSTGSMTDRINKAGIPYARIAENIAYGQADAIEAHQGLMNSYGHRVNIINPEFRALGTGAYYNYYTQKFINPR